MTTSKESLTKPLTAFNKWRNIGPLTRRNEGFWKEGTIYRSELSSKGTLVLAGGITGRSMLVKYAQSKKWLPEDPFKTS